MKQTSILVTFILAVWCARGQGTFFVDQGINPTNAPGGFGSVQPDPTGESFVPTFSSVEFAQLYLGDAIRNQGPTLSVDLWSGSLGGTLLGQSAPVTLSTTFVGVTTFYFSTPVAVIPGTTYYLQPIIQSGDNEDIGIVPGTYYANGIAYLNGTPQSGSDLWFREGIVPEPSSFSLAALGIAGLYPILRHRRVRKPKTHQQEPCSEEQPLPHSCSR